MRLDRKETLQALAAIRGVVSQRPGIPALTGVLVDDDAGVTFTATDLEVSCHVKVAYAEGPAGGWHNGPALIPARMFEAACKASKAPAVDLEHDGKTATVDGVHNIRLLVAEDFPTLAPGAEVFDRFDAQAFAEIVRRVAPAASDDEARPVLTGVLLERPTTDDYPRPATMAATDSYRLHVGELACANPGTAEGWKAIIPERALSAVAKVIGRKGTGSVAVGVLDGAVEFRFGRIRWTSRIIEGEFPNYRQLIPDESAESTVIRADTDALAAAVKSAGAYARDTTPVRLNVDERGLELSASSPDLGSFGPLRLEGSALSQGVPVVAAFNPGYLGECIAATANGGLSRLELRDGLKPAVMRGAGVVALVMPVRLPAVT
jgi:DNA polymerase-3 subunit beta